MGKKEMILDVPVIAFRLCTGMDLLPLWKKCVNPGRRIRMGKSGQARTKAYYRHERMISEYRKLYREVEEAYGRDWI